MCRSARRETAASPRSRRGPKPRAGVPKNGTPLDAFFASRFSISLSPSFLARCVRESRRARGLHNHGCRSRRGGDRDWRFVVLSVDTAPRISLFLYAHLLLFFRCSQIVAVLPRRNVRQSGTTLPLLLKRGSTRIGRTRGARRCDRREARHDEGGRGRCARGPEGGQGR